MWHFKVLDRMLSKLDLVIQILVIKCLKMMFSELLSRSAGGLYIYGDLKMSVNSYEMLFSFSDGKQAN